MNLYEVKGSNHVNMDYPDVEFILAVSESEALKKFLEVNKERIMNTRIKFICERDKIVPTIEPRIEFG